MEDKKIYVVSFSDSRKYIMRDSAEREKSRLEEIENILNEFLGGKFPEETFAYYTTPKVEEINENLASTEFAGYPLLDESAVEEIKKELEQELKDRDADVLLDSNAPYSDVDAEAAGIPESVDMTL